MIQLAYEILNAPVNNPLSEVAHFSAIAAFLWIAPYATLTITSPNERSIYGDILMGIFTIGLPILAYLSYGIEGIYATVIGYALGSSPLLLLFFIPIIGMISIMEIADYYRQLTKQPQHT